MVKLIKNISCSLNSDTNSKTTLLKGISSECGFEDYINIFSFIGLIQNFKNINETVAMVKNENIGVQQKKEQKEITIDYSE